MPLQFCKLLIVSVTSLIVQGAMNIESELGFGRVSNIEIVLETGWIWEAKVGPTFAKKSLNLKTMTLGSFITNSFTDKEGIVLLCSKPCVPWMILFMSFQVSRIFPFRVSNDRCNLFSAFLIKDVNLFYS